MILNPNKNFVFHIFLIIGLCQFALFPIKSQEKHFEKKITLDVNEERFTKVLEIIEKKTQIKFCYNSDDIPQDKNVTVHTKGTSVEKLLSALFSAAELDYKIINGQVAIFKLNKNALKEISPIIAISSVNPARTVFSSEKSIIYDTIITTVYDTLKLPVIDTLKLHDTVFIKQFDTLVYSFKNKKNKLLLKKDKKLEFYVGSFYPFSNVLFASAPQYRAIADSLKNNTSSKFSYTIGTGYIYIYENYSIYAGLSVASINEQLSYCDVTEKFSYNQYLFLNLPLLLGYKIGKRRNLSAEFIGGITINLLVWENSKQFQLQKVTCEVSNAPHSNYSLVIYSWQAGTGLNFKVTKKTEAFARAMVQIPIRSIFSNEFYISRFQSYFMISAGLSYSLK